jgi:glutathione peroxidase
MLATSASPFYSFNMKTIDGKSFDFEKLKGRKVLIVNTASECGYTPQYKNLELLHQQHPELVILGVPANEFGGQEPGSNEVIANFCKKNYGVSFTMLEKSVVKGEGIHPLFKWLTKEASESLSGDIRWNFEKFLIDEKGQLINRFKSGVDPLGSEIINAIK